MNAPTPPSPTADVSVRVAWTDDAEAITAVQVDTWPEMYGHLVPAAALPDDRAAVADQWRNLLARPADARQRVLVALERNRVVGFVLTGPAGDPDSEPVADGEMSELTVAPAERGKGHASRLLQAAIDTLQADRFTRATTWSIATDDALRGFLSEAGWAPDGAFRELDLDGSGSVRVKQVRLHTDISAH